MSEFKNVHRFGFNMDNPEIVCPYCGYTYTNSNELSPPIKNLKVEIKIEPT